MATAYHNWCELHGSWWGDELEVCPQCDRSRAHFIAKIALNDAITATEKALEAYEKAGLPKACLGAALYLLQREKEDRNRG